MTMAGQRYRILIYGKQRRSIDARQMAQVLILLGRHLYEQQHARRSESEATTFDPVLPRPESDGERSQ